MNQRGVELELGVSFDPWTVTYLWMPLPLERRSWSELGCWSSSSSSVSVAKNSGTFKGPDTGNRDTRHHFLIR